MDELDAGGSRQDDKLSLVDKKDPASGATSVARRCPVSALFGAASQFLAYPITGVRKPSDAAYDCARPRNWYFTPRRSGGERIQVKVAITGDKKFGDSSKVSARPSGSG